MSANDEKIAPVTIRPYEMQTISYDQVLEGDRAVSLYPQPTGAPGRVVSPLNHVAGEDLVIVHDETPLPPPLPEPPEPPHQALQPFDAHAQDTHPPQLAEDSAYAIWQEEAALAQTDDAAHRNVRYHDRDRYFVPLQPALSAEVPVEGKRDSEETVEPVLRITPLRPLGKRQR